LREKDLAPRELLALFARAQRISEKFGAKLFLNGRADLARAAHADGLHLPQNEAPLEVARMVLGFHTPAGVSVHSLDEAKAAAQEGADYLLFGSVYETASHPGQPGAGLDALKEIVASVRVPVYAVGGITAARVPEILETGAAGIAVISEVWSSPNPTAAVRALREALGERDEPLHGAPGGQPSPLAAIISQQSRG
jgi:thiamine-phosphate pyrophosphorylase